jgi:hypothetical protein
MGIATRLAIRAIAGLVLTLVFAAPSSAEHKLAHQATVAYCSTLNALYTLDPDTGQITLLGKFSASAQIRNLAFDSRRGLLYGLDRLGASATLYLINPQTAALHEIGSFSIPSFDIDADLNALTCFGYDRATDGLYVIYQGPNAALDMAAFLYHVDPHTAAVTEIGHANFRNAITRFLGMTFDSKGRLYINQEDGWNGQDGWISILDVLAGTVTPVIFVGTTFNRLLVDIAYRPDANFLYGIDLNDGELFLITIDGAGNKAAIAKLAAPVWTLTFGNSLPVPVGP